MKNRFKFRAWDKYREEYIYEIQNETKFSKYINQEEDYIVEQCTGTKDKKGQLIYEGDIVKYHVIDKTSFPIRKENLVLKTRKVTFKKGYFSPVFNLDLNDVEIIGNIHEKPELLEVNDE